MIRSLYETHLEVTDVERSVAFYQSLGLELAALHPARRIAFFWIGKPGQQLLGLWEVAAGQSIHERHFAFAVDLLDITHAVEWLT